MGVFRWESSSIRMMIIRFSATLSTYVKNEKKITACISVLSVRPSRMNSVTDDLFLISSY